MADAREEESTKAPARHRWVPRFLSIWTSQQISLVGSQIDQFALVWWLTKTTGSATVLATATLAALLPQVLLGPFSGALVDRWSRRRVLIAADLVIAFASAGLAYLFYRGSVQLWHIFLIMGVRSAATGFHWPAMAASTSLMVPKAHLPRVAGLNQTMNGALNVVAPPLGALLFAILPMYGILGINVFTAAIAIFPLTFTPIPQPNGSPAPGGPRVSVLTQVREGFHYVLGWPGLLFLLSMAALVNFLVSPAFSLLPLVVSKHFGGDVIHLGWMNSAFGIGLVAGGLTLGVWGGFRRRIATALTGVTGMGAGFVLVGLIPPWGFWLAAGGVLLAGLSSAIANGSLLALLQTEAAPEMQGRTLTMIQSVVSVVTPLSLLVAGPLADRMGIQFWYLASGATMLALGIGGFFVPAVLFVEERAAAHRMRTAEDPPPRVSG